MADEIVNEPFHWNVYFIGPQGFREHFYVSANDAVTLAARREALLGFLKEWGAVSDVRPPLWGSEDKTGPKTSSKLDKFKDKTAGEVTGEPMTQAAVASGLAPAEKPTEEVAEGIKSDAPIPEMQKPKTSSKLAKAASKTVSPVEAPTETPPADALSKSKLAKYAKPEKS